VFKKTERKFDYVHDRELQPQISEREKQSGINNNQKKSRLNSVNKTERTKITEPNFHLVSKIKHTPPINQLIMKTENNKLNKSKSKNNFLYFYFFIKKF